MSTQENTFLVKDIKNIVDQNDCDALLINAVAEQAISLKQALKETIDHNHLTILTDDECVTLSNVILLSEPKLADDKSTLVMLCSNKLQFSNIEYCLVSSTDINKMSVKDLISSTEVQIFQGDNYFGEEVL